MINRKFILINILNLFILTSCAQEKPSQEIIKTYQDMENYLYNTDKRPLYGVEYSTPLKFELWVNDVPMYRTHSISQKSGAEIINDLLLENGEHQITVKFHPNHKDEADTIITQAQMRHTEIKLVKAEKVIGGPYGETKNREELLDLKIPEIKEGVPYYEQTFTFTTTDLPYTLEGWKNSEDLSKLDRDVLEKDVLSYYEKLRNILDEGSVESFQTECLQRSIEVAISTYETHLFKEDFQSNSETNLKIKGLMLPIEKYRMNIFGNGRLVELVRIDDYLKDDPVLLAQKPTSYGLYPTIIHKPKGSEDFKIIRK